MNTKMTQNNSDKNNEIKVVLTKSQIKTGVRNCINQAINAINPIEGD